MNSDYDVLIIGGGLAGGSLALALHASGINIAVVEAVSDEQRRMSPSGERALALANGTMRLFEQLGMASAVKQRSVPIRAIHISDRDHFGKTRLSANNEGVEALGYVVTARNLEDCISDALDRSKVRRVCPARLIRLRSGPNSVWVTLSQGDDSFDLNSRLVVGADGGNSTVRRLANISQKARDYKQTAIITLVRPNIYHDFTAFERFTSSGPMALLPTDHGYCSVVWTRQSDNAKLIMGLSDSAFIGELQGAFGNWLGGLELCGTRGAFPLKLVRADAIVSKRVVLVGNAVHQLHPIAGQGLNLAMRDVAQLAEMLIKQRQADKDLGAEALLKRFSKVRKADHRRVIGFTDSLVSIFSNDWIPLATARSIGLLLLDFTPWGKHKIARYSMGLCGPMPRLVSRRSS